MINSIFKRTLLENGHFIMKQERQQQFFCILLVISLLAGIRVLIIEHKNKQ